MAQPQYEVITFQDDEGKRFQGVTRDHGRTFEQMVPIPLDVDDPVTDKILDRGFADEQWITVSVLIQHGVGLVNTVFWSGILSPLQLTHLHTYIAQKGHWRPLYVSSFRLQVQHHLPPTPPWERQPSWSCV